MVKIDRAALTALQQNVTTQADTAQGQLTSLRVALNQVTTDPDFRGKGATNTKAYLEAGPDAAAKALALSLTDLAEDLRKTVTSLDAVDSSPDAVVSTQELDHLTDETRAIVKAARAALTAANTAIAAADGASDNPIAALNLEDFDTASTSLSHRLQSARRAVVDWDAKHQTDAAADKKMLSSVSNALITMAGQHRGQGIISYDSTGLAARQLASQANRFAKAKLARYTAKYGEVTITKGAGGRYLVFVNGKLDTKKTARLAQLHNTQDREQLFQFFAGAVYQVAENNGITELMDAVFGDGEPAHNLQASDGYRLGQQVGNLATLIQSGAEFLGGTLWLGGTGALEVAAVPETGGASLSVASASAAVGYGIYAHAALVGGAAIHSIMTGDHGDVKPNGKKADREDVLAVDNMQQFLDETKWGKEVKAHSVKTTKVVKGQRVYQVGRSKADRQWAKKYGMKSGDSFYLDSLHKNHIEIFDNRGSSRAVRNLDGSLNSLKTTRANKRSITK